MSLCGDCDASCDQLNDKMDTGTRKMPATEIIRDAKYPSVYHLKTQGEYIDSLIVSSESGQSRHDSVVPNRTLLTFTFSCQECTLDEAWKLVEHRATFIEQQLRHLMAGNLYYILRGVERHGGSISSGRGVGSEGEGIRNPLYLPGEGEAVVVPGRVAGDVQRVFTERGVDLLVAPTLNCSVVARRLSEFLGEPVRMYDLAAGTPTGEQLKKAYDKLSLMPYAPPLTKTCLKGYPHVHFAIGHSLPPGRMKEVADALAGYRITLGTIDMGGYVPGSAGSGSVRIGGSANPILYLLKYCRDPATRKVCDEEKIKQFSIDFVRSETEPAVREIMGAIVSTVNARARDNLLFIHGLYPSFAALSLSPPPVAVMPEEDVGSYTIYRAGNLREPVPESLKVPLPRNPLNPEDHSEVHRRDILRLQGESGVFFHSWPGSEEAQALFRDPGSRSRAGAYTRLRVEKQEVDLKEHLLQMIGLHKSAKYLKDFKAALDLLLSHPYHVPSFHTVVIDFFCIEYSDFGLYLLPDKALILPLEQRYLPAFKRYDRGTLVEAREVYEGVKKLEVWERVCHHLFGEDGMDPDEYLHKIFTRLPCEPICFESVGCQSNAMGRLREYLKDYYTVWYRHVKLLMVSRQRNVRSADLKGVVLSTVEVADREKQIEYSPTAQLGSEEPGCQHRAAAIFTTSRTARKAFDDEMIKMAGKTAAYLKHVEKNGINIMEKHVEYRDSDPDDIKEFLHGSAEALEARQGLRALERGYNPQMKARHTPMMTARKIDSTIRLVETREGFSMTPEEGVTFVEEMPYVIFSILAGAKIPLVEVKTEEELKGYFPEIARARVGSGLHHDIGSGFTPPSTPVRRE